MIRQLIRGDDPTPERLRLWTSPDGPDGPLPEGAVCVEWVGCRVGHQSTYGLLAGVIGALRKDPHLGAVARWSGSPIEQVDEVWFGLPDEYRDVVDGESFTPILLAHGRLTSSRRVFRALAGFLSEVLTQGMPDDDEAVWSLWDRTMRSVGTPAIGPSIQGTFDEAIGGQPAPRVPRRSWMPRAAVVGAIGIGAAVAVLSAGSNTSGPTPAAPGVVVYRAVGTVLEQGPGRHGGGSTHGPQLCLGGIRTSLPPQCGGPDVVGWDWSGLPAQVAGTTRWGGFVVVGTFADNRFTLTQTPRRATAADHPAPANPFEIAETPCAAPPGGWKPSPAAEAGRNRALAYINRSKERSAFWFDTGADKRGPVLNVRFARNAASHEAKLRGLFRGNLCVTHGGRAHSELNAIQSELFAKGGSLIDGEGKPRVTPGVLSGGVEEWTGVVVVQVVLDNGDLQRAVDATYGSGAVRVESALKPVR